MPLPNQDHNELTTRRPASRTKARSHSTTEHIVRWIIIAAAIGLFSRILPTLLLVIVLVAWYIYYLVDDNR